VVKEVLQLFGFMVLVGYPAEGHLLEVFHEEVGNDM